MEDRMKHFAVGLLLASAAVACQPGGEDRPYVSVGADAEALKAAFNADSGTVRIVMLVAPT